MCFFFNNRPWNIYSGREFQTGERRGRKKDKEKERKKERKKVRKKEEEEEEECRSLIYLSLSFPSLPNKNNHVLCRRTIFFGLFNFLHQKEAWVTKGDIILREDMLGIEKIKLTNLLERWTKQRWWWWRRRRKIHQKGGGRGGKRRKKKL